MAFEVEYLLSNTGHKIAKVNGYFIHSKYDPIKEAKSYIENVEVHGKGIILFGYGLGYFYEQMKLYLSDEQKVIVIDPIFNNIKIEEKNVEIIHYNQLNSDILFKHFGAITDIKVISSPNYDKICGLQYLEILKMTKDFLRIRNVSNNTLKQQAVMWNLHYVENLSYITMDQTIAALKGKFDLPIVIASGGPSLTKQLPLLRKYLDNCILIAAGSTVNSLISAEITPDIVVSIDGTDMNYEHFKDLSLENSLYIYQLQSHAKIRGKLKSKALYFLGSTFQAQKKYIEEIFEEPAVPIVGGGSVANFALSIARYISSNGPITLIGQDLAYTNNETHAANNKRQVKLDNLEINMKNKFYSQGYNGDLVITDYPFYSMKRSFENIVSHLPNSDMIFNSTEGGILIEGFSQIPFQSYVEQYMTKEITKNKLYILAEKEESVSKRQKQRLTDKLKLEVADYDILIKLLNINLKLLKSNKLKYQFEQSIIQKMKKNDRKIEEIVEKSSVAIGAQMINLEVLTKFKEQPKESDIDMYNRIYAQNEYLYQNLIELVKIIQMKTNEIISNLVR